MTRLTQSLEHRVKIHWGLASLSVDRNITEHSFKTREELNAFMEGVEEAVGWMGHEILEDSRENGN